MAAIAYMFLLLLVSLKPGSSSGQDSAFKLAFYNLAHIPAYALLTLLLVYATAARSLVWAFIAACSYGVFNEWLQHFVPERMTSITDMLLNAIGAFTVLYFLRKRRVRGEAQQTV